MKEMKQIHDMNTYTPMDATTLTAEQKAKAIRCLFLLTEKRNGDIKGRKVADGSVQRTYDDYKKEDNASPTAANESLMIGSAIAAHERRDVMTCDLPGAYLHAFTDEEVIMALRGKVAELLCMVQPELYRPYVIYDKNEQPVLYVRLNKALYGLLRSALLFYMKLRKDLEAIGFKVNPYDPCVANRMFRGKQQTVIWHVDDLFCSCENKFANTELAAYLSAIYGDGMTVNRGDVHDYRGSTHKRADFSNTVDTICELLDLTYMPTSSCS